MPIPRLPRLLHPPYIASLPGSEFGEAGFPGWNKGDSLDQLASDLSQDGSG